MGTKTNQAVFILALAAFSATAQDTHKCKQADGSIVYQDSPCAGKRTVRVITSEGDSGKPVESAGAEIVRSRERSVTMANERNLTELRDRIDYFERLNAYAQSSMDVELARLRQKKASASNNLAGATWENSISGEMQAVTQRYEAEVNKNNAIIAGIREEIRKLEVIAKEKKKVSDEASK